MGDTDSRSGGDPEHDDARLGDNAEGDRGEGAMDSAPGDPDDPYGDPAGDEVPAADPDAAAWDYVAAERRERRRRMVPAFLIGVLAGMLVLGVIWVTTTSGADTDASARLGRGLGRSGGPAGGAAATAGPSADAGTTAPPTRLDRCREADTELAPPLRAAAASLGQWEVHVGAMNQLVVGAITLQQASDFWAQTRVGAQRKIDRFHDAMRALGTQDAGCPAPDRLVGGATPALRACARRVAGDRRSLDAARVAIGTWDGHVRNMEMLRMGHLSPAAATRMWLASWKRGVRELRDYQGAVRAAEGAGRC